MIKVLIVDDEYYAVKGLLSGVQWDSAGVQEVHEAYHSAMAREVLQREEIDIMICDIEMPEGSGLELMAWVREQEMTIETIVLTCHSEFSYAQQALKLGGSDYLLKPVIYSDLEEVLKRTIRKVEDRRKSAETDGLYQKYVELWNGRKPILTERFWQDLFGRALKPTRAAIEEALVSYDLPVKQLERIGLVLLSVEQWGKPLSEHEEEIMEFALRKAAEETLLEGRSGHVVRDRRGNAIVILYAGEVDLQPEKLIDDCRMYIEACNRYFYCNLSCYVSETVPIEGAMQAYLGLLDAEYRNVKRTNEVVPVQGRPNEPERGLACDTGLLLDVADSIEQGGKEQALRALQAKLDGMPPESMTPAALSAIYHALLQAVYFALQRKGFSAHLLYGDREWPSEQTVIRSLSRLKQWAEEVLDAAFGLLNKDASESPAVLKVKSYITDHLDRDVTREELAAHVYLNPAYLSRLFRKETGMVLTDYLLQEKMRKASDLLAGTDRTISEIADSLGYGNFSYFARLFRKVYDVSPHDYRKSIRSPH